MKLKLFFSITCVAIAALSISTNAFSLFIDGTGHYSLKGETRTNPGFSQDTGTYQAIEQNFLMEGEARLNDRSSFFLELRLFDEPREAFLGDEPMPRDCRDSEDSENCEGRHQNTGEPGYKPYTLKASKAYARYAFDYCIVEAGRRGRDWGLGVFLDSGKGVFSTDSSVFDGVTCDVNVQKSQTLGFSFGYDKLSETGNYIDNPQDSSSTGENFTARDRNFGPNDGSDDIDQFFFTIEFDDRKANAGAAFTKQVGVYFANVTSPKSESGGARGGANTDLKFLDLYTGLFFSNFSLRNEVVFRLGKSADPSWQRMGGAAEDGGAPATNKLDAIGIAGEMEWTVSRSGSAIGPAEYKHGDASRHLFFLNYAYAPGDSDGYYNGTDASAGESNRDKKVTAIAFHQNYRPALILFNGRPEAEALRVDGSFNPARVTNVTLLGTGYRYESIDGGSFELKLITASLNEGMPGAVKSYYKAQGDGARPIGYNGNSLGYELDLTYSYSMGREVDFGTAFGAAIPGDAWKVHTDKKNVPSYALQSWMAFKF